MKRAFAKAVIALIGVIAQLLPSHVEAISCSASAGGVSLSWECDEGNCKATFSYDDEGRVTSITGLCT